MERTKLQPTKKDYKTPQLYAYGGIRDLTSNAPTSASSNADVNPTKKTA